MLVREKLSYDYYINWEPKSNIYNKTDKDITNDLLIKMYNEYIVKLEKRINEFLKPNVVDESRLAQEIVIYSDKCSIEEEVTTEKQLNYPTRVPTEREEFLRGLKNNKGFEKAMKHAKEDGFGLFLVCIQWNIKLLHRVLDSKRSSYKFYS